MTTASAGALSETATEVTIIQNQQFKQYENKGLTGLANVGNSCYLNSCMQLLSHTYELNDFLTNNNGRYKQKIKDMPDSVAILEWDKLRDLMWSNNCTVAPNGFVLAIRKLAHYKKKDIFTGYAQNDLQEFLLFIIDCLHTSLSREVDMNISGVSHNETDELAKTCYTMMKQMFKKEYSEMLDLFYGIHVSEISHLNTGESLSLRPEPFSVLSLSLPENKTEVSIYECFDLYCEKEKLEGENAWFNEKTNQKENINRGIIFWSLPKVLIIDLKRWNGYTKKKNTLVSTPLTNVDFTKYVKGYNKHTYIYELYGVCNHHGGVSGGHYTAFVKNANDKWYHFNDTDVKEIASTHIVTPQSYCFFYRKIK